VSPTPKKAAKPAKKAAARKPTGHKQAAIQRVSRAPKAAPPAADERDYLVIYEEPDPYGLPSDDVLVLDIDARTPKRGEVDVQQKLDLELTNSTSRLGTAGFATTMVGCLLGVILMIAFAVIYPQDWYSGSAGTVRAMILLSVATIALMIVGTVLTHYGRRIQASSRLSDVRIIEKASQNRASFE
jgi:VIT1/CCC1 family predicted Fe2+/Mn2+ transporter